LGVAAGIVLLIGGGLALLAYASLAKEYDLTKLGRMPSRSVVYDRNGEEIGRLHGSNRVAVALGDVSKDFRDALLVREDNRFYDHKGIDPVGVARAIYRNVAKNKREGASTVTMQLARNSFSELMEQKTLHRKLVEVMLARRIEKTYTKDQILEFYVNRIFFGSGIYGVELASQSYFGKPAKDMTLGESAMLAGIIRGPNRFSPFRHYDDAVSERDTVLKRMLAEEVITQQQHDVALGERVRVLPQSHTKRTVEDSYALDAVRRDLENALSRSDAEDGGLSIHTSIDLRLQRAAEAALERGLAAVERRPGYAHGTRAGFEKSGCKGDPGYLQGAIVLLDNKTGGTLAVVGGRDIRHSQFNRAVTAERPIGSAFKPFVYTAAIARGMMPGSWVDDGPLRAGEITGAGENWRPKNSDGQSLGRIGAELGLIKSRNTASVRVGDRAGIEKVKELAGRVGIDVAEDETSPQLYLGNVDCDLESLTSAYTIFPNSGARVPASTISHIADVRGDVFYRAAAQSYPAAPAGATVVTSHILQKVLEPGGTASRARRLGFRAPAGGKTGTTDAFKDAWFVGYTDKVTCGVWAGLDTPATIASGAYGGSVALPIWTEVMLACEKAGFKASALRPAMPMADVLLCRTSGGFADRACERAGTAYRLGLPYELAPKTTCDYHSAATASAVPRALPVKRPRVLRRLLGNE
jgi:penicillin-binding protein 1A